MTPGPGSATTHHPYTCPLCECMCGLDVAVEDGHVRLIRANHDDVWSRGFLCPKGTALGHVHHDPDRLRAPMVRDGETWREVSWEAAFQRCEELVHPLFQREGASAFAVFVGNASGHSWSLTRYHGHLFGPSRIRDLYSVGSIDQWPKNVSSFLLYGHPWMVPIPDVGEGDYWLILGANPHTSGGSLLAHPDLMGDAARIQANGGKVVVVDPRRTETADRADEWIGIQPGTDALWLLAIVHELFANGWVDFGTVATLVDGVDALRAACREFTPEAVAERTRVPPETTRRIAREIHEARAAAIYGRIGLCNQEFGTLASWLVDVVAICSGHFDRPGTVVFPNPVPFPITWLAQSAADGARIGRWHSRVRGAPEIFGELPVVCLAEEIDTPGPGQTKGLVTVAGNPAISLPDAARLEAALPTLECYIAVDNYLNATTRHAHVVLPGLSPFEAPHFDDIFWGFATRSAAKWSEPVFPLRDRPDEWEILIRLGQILAGRHDADTDVAALDDAAFTRLCAAQGLDPAPVLARYDHGGPERMIDWSIRVGPFGDRYGERDGVTLADFKAAPNGIDFGPTTRRAADVVCTDDGKIHLAPDELLADLPRLRARLAAPDPGMVLISRRHLRSKNTWMHNVRVLVKGRNRCTLLVNPADATRLGLTPGGLARVSSSAGAIEAAVEVSDEVIAGVVSLPNGWGQGQPGTRLTVASEHPGVNNNVLTPSDRFDVISGNAAVNGIPVEVAPA